MRHTKVIATVGPASNSPQMLEALLLAGVDLFRLNFSHGTHDSHAAVYHRFARSRAGPGASCRHAGSQRARKFEPARSPAVSRSRFVKGSRSRLCRATIAEGPDGSPPHLSS